MSCLYCLTAHQRGRFWVCKRCGNLMFLCSAPDEGDRPLDTGGLTADAGEWGGRPYALQRRPIVYRRNTEPPPTRQQNRDGRHQPVGGRRSVVPLARRELGRGAPATGDAASPSEADVSDAVVLDLDAARRVRGTRT